MVNGVICKACGNQFTGKYCNNCGEKVYTDHDKSFRHLFEEVFHFLTHVDNKFFKTFWLLFKKPGFVSEEFCYGVRKKYFKPVSLFLVGVVVYLLFPLTKGLNLSFNTTINTFDNIGLGFAHRAAEWKAATHHFSMEKLAEVYDHKSAAFAKVMLFLLLPIAALVLLLLFPKKNKYFFDHFILGTELSTSFIFFAFLLLPLLLKWIFKLIALFVNVNRYGDWVFAPVMLSVLIPLWATAFHRFYKERWARSYGKSTLFILLFMVIGVFYIYRFILFFTILLFI